MKRIWLWLGGGLVAAAIIAGGLFFVLFAKPAPAARSDIRLTELSQQEKERMALEQVTHNGFAQKAGEIRLTKLEQSPQGWSIELDAKGHEKDLAGIAKAAQQLFGYLQQTGVPLDNVAVVFRSDAFRDDYGHQLTDLAVATMRFTGQTMRKVNWEDVSPAKLPLLADSFWRLPLLPDKQQESS